MVRFLHRSIRSAPVSPSRSLGQKEPSWTSEEENEPAGDVVKPTPSPPNKALPTASAAAAAVAGDKENAPIAEEPAAPQQRDGIEGRYHVLQRAHVAVLKQQVGLSQESAALKKENAGLKRENRALHRENNILKQEFAEALQDNKAWCLENEVLQAEYTEAFLDKTAEAFQTTVALENENEAWRLENEELRKAGADAAEKREECLREIESWKHENAVLHGDYTTHLEHSAEILRENTSLMERIAAFNLEYIKITASNKAYIEHLMVGEEDKDTLDGLAEAVMVLEDERGAGQSGNADVSSDAKTSLWHVDGGGEEEENRRRKRREQQRQQQLQQREAEEEEEEEGGGEAEEEEVEEGRGGEGGCGFAGSPLGSKKDSIDTVVAGGERLLGVPLAKKGSADTLVGDWGGDEDDQDDIDWRQREEGEEGVAVLDRAGGETRAHARCSQRGGEKATKKQKKTDNAIEHPQAAATSRTEHWNGDYRSANDDGRGWLQDTKTWNHDRVLKRNSILTRNAEPECKATPAPEAEPRPENDSQSKPKFDSDSKSETERESTSESTSKSDSESKSEAKPDSTSETEAEADLESKSDAKSEAELELEFESGAESGFEPEQPEAPATWSLVQLIAFQLEIRAREEYADAIQASHILPELAGSGDDYSDASHGQEEIGC